MSRKHSTDRRYVLGALGGALLAMGFDPVTRRFVGAADAEAATAAMPLPVLDGELLLEPPAEFTRDAGYHLTRSPWAVLVPGSIHDIVRMVEYCRSHRIPIGPRGQGHTTHGQSLVEGGVMVSTHTLDEIHAIGSDFADVGAGLLWRDLLEQTLARGLVVPAHASFMALSVGGTLSMGGVPANPHRGLQVDHVRALQVVTGRGEVLWCSPTERADLFDGVLGGLGQLGIITRAVIGLAPAPTQVKTWVLRYLDPHRFFADLKMLTEREEAEWVFGQIAPPGPTALPEPPADVVALLGPTASAFNLVMPALSPLLMLATGLLSGGPGVWIYQIVVGKDLGPGETANASTVLRGTGDLALARTSTIQTFSDYMLRVDALVDLLKTLGLWRDVPHPWCDVFLPEAVAESFVTSTMRAFRYEDVGTAGLALLFPLRRRLHQRAQPVVPVAVAPDEIVYMFGIETSAPGPGPNAEFVARMLVRNRALYEQARALGATLYSHCAVDMSPDDWVAHFGPYYPELQRLKALHDPDGVLTPGPGIFPPA